MKVLIDECAPKKLKSVLTANGYDCATVQEAGWSGKENGELLADADGRFDALVTVDQNIYYQQNLTERKIAVVIIRASSNRLEDLEPYFPACVLALRSIRPGTVVEVGLPRD